MLEIKGKMNTAVCFARVVEEEAVVMEAREDELCAMLEGGPTHHVRVTRHEDEVRP
jgi:hypothetical protein